MNVKRRWVVCFLGLVVLTVAVALFLSRDGRKANAPRLIVLATWYTNGQQFVKVRTDPLSATITYADIVSVYRDADAPPSKIRSGMHLVPFRYDTETNASLRFVAVPGLSSSFRGTLLTFTPGIYTVAYTPTESAERVRFGVALEQNGSGDFVQRLRNFWEQKTLTSLRMKSYQDPVFITIDPTTNAVTRTR